MRKYSHFEETPREYKIKRKLDTHCCSYCPSHRDENNTLRKRSPKKKRKKWKE